MKKNVKYFNAAAMIAVDENHWITSTDNLSRGCCRSLEVENCDDSKFFELFSRDPTDSGTYWFGILTKKNQLSRHIALLLMYEMGEQ